MKLRNTKFAQHIVIMLALATLVFPSCGNEASNARQSGGGVGGSEGGTSCTMPSTYSNPRHYQGPDGKKLVSFELDVRLDGLESPSASNGGVANYPLGDCHANKVDCSKLLPACNCELVYPEGSANQVIRATYEISSGIELGGILVVELDDVGGDPVSTK